MTFDDALGLAMYQGKKIRREGWNEDLYVCNKKDKLVYHCNDDFDGSVVELKFVDFSGHREDMLANDWEEVKE